MREVPRNIDRSPWSKVNRRARTVAYLWIIAAGCLICWFGGKTALTFLSQADRPSVSACVTVGFLELSGLVLIRVGYCMICSQYARFSFSGAGVAVKYPLQRLRTVPWGDLQQVCVCYGDYRKDGKKATVVCCVRKGERPTLLGRWRTESPFHYRGVMAMYHTQDLFDEIERACPMEIIDLRETPAYKY